MNQITALSKIFARYKIYPIDKYISQSPVHCFQRLYRKNYFSSQVEVFYACLYSVVKSKNEYIKFTQGLDSKNLFAFNRWEIMQKQLLDWNIDLRFCYITDASKVYKDDSWKNFDKQKSKMLLETKF